MKIPDYRNALKMARHVNQCTNDKCKKTWRGPWGTFIGGDQGAQYFDLT
jgi:hypothetical protein